MATEGTPPGSVKNHHPLEQPVDPQPTDSLRVKQTPSPAHPLQVHVPGYPPLPQHPQRTLPGGLLQSQYAGHVPGAPSNQPGLIPFPYGAQALLPQPAARPLGGVPVQMAPQQLYVPGGGIMRPHRRTMGPMVHPYQRVAAQYGASQYAAQPQQPQQPYIYIPSRGVSPASAAAAAAAQAQAQVQAQTQSLAHLQYAPYRMPVGPTMGMDPVSAAMYAQAYAQYGQYPQMMAVQQPVSSYGQSIYDPQKLLNAHYTQMLVQERYDSGSPQSGSAANINGSAQLDVNESS